MVLIELRQRGHWSSTVTLRWIDSDDDSDDTHRNDDGNSSDDDDLKGHGQAGGIQGIRGRQAASMQGIRSRHRADSPGDGKISRQDGNMAQPSNPQPHRAGKSRNRYR